MSEGAERESELDDTTDVLASESSLDATVSVNSSALEDLRSSDSEPSTTEPVSDSGVDARSNSIVVDAGSSPRTTDSRFRQLQHAHYRRTDRLFAVLMACQAVTGVLLALFVSPARWTGSGQSAPTHVWVAAGLGALVSAVSISLALARPGHPVTRSVIAIAQMVWSAIFIHLTAGRIETHFHVFGSLAFLAFYRDWRILVPATLVVVVDLVLRQSLWPESVYGATNPAWWRFLEHVAWVLFEDVILIISCVVGVREMREAGLRRAEAEFSHEALVRNEKLAAVGQLAASVGHELRNPLAAVRAAAMFVGRRVKDGKASDPRVPQFLGVIEHELNVCSKIISDLLDYARERPPELSPCPLRSLVDDAIAVVPNSGGVQLVNDVPVDLPVPNLDRDQFRQVISNLVQNAVEAIPAEIKGRVIVTGVRHGNGIRLSLSDNGAGIPAETLDHIFQPLFTTKTKGTGLGLAIVHSVLRRHAAQISVESELGRGTTFHVDVTVTGRQVEVA